MNPGSRAVLLSLIEEQTEKPKKKSCLPIIFLFVILITVINVLILSAWFIFRMDKEYIISYIFADSPSLLYTPQPVPTKNYSGLTSEDEAIIEKFINNWKEAYEASSPNLLSYYIDGTRTYSDVRASLLDQRPLEIDLTYKETKKISDSFVYLELYIKSSSEGEEKEGTLLLELQKPSGFSWKIYSSSCEPKNLLEYSKSAEPYIVIPENTPVPVSSSIGVEAPEICQKFLPYEEWEEEYIDYFERHYRTSTLTFTPKAIVMHYTATHSLEDTLNIFINGAEYDEADGGILFGHLSVHYVIDKDGTIYKTLPLNRKCRGAYGVNHVAISIEMVAMNEEELLQQKETLEASFKLVRYLMAEFKIPEKMVWGHYHVSDGLYSNSTVKDYYTDYGDSIWPDCYPDSALRFDPGKTYMKKLYKYLEENSKGE